MSAETITYKPNPDARIRAIRFDGKLSSIPAEWRALGMIQSTDDGVQVLTNKGPAPLNVGDYLVQGTAGELYPVTPAVMHERWVVA